MARSVPIPIPLNGLNTVSPDLPLEAGYARELTNYSIVNGRLRMRPAVTFRMGSGDPAIVRNIVWFTVTDGTVSYIRNDGNVFNSANTLLTTLSGTGISATKFAYEMKHVSLHFVIGVAMPRNANYPHTAWTFTTLGIVETDITSACSHKGRLYVCNGSTIEYSNVGQITGAMYDSFNVSEFMDGQSVVRIFSNSITSGNGVDNVFIIFGAGGKVLVYQGDYPASSSWNLIGNYNMSIPATAGCFVDADGDIFVIGNEYPYWFGEMMTSGALAARENTPANPILNLYNNTSFTGGSYLKQLDAIIVTSSQSLGYAIGRYQAQETGVPFFFPNVGSRLVYFRKYKSWAFWLTNNFDYPIRFDAFGDAYGTITGTNFLWAVNRLRLTSYHTSDELRGLFGATNFVPINTSWKTPFINAFNGKNQKVEGVRPFFSSALNGFLEKIRLIFDYSDYNSTTYGFYTQPTAPAQINPGNYADSQIDVNTTTWDQYSPYNGVSGMGGGVSLQITQAPKTGSADVQLNEIYSATLYISDGGDMI